MDAGRPSTAGDVPDFPPALTIAGYTLDVDEIVRSGAWDPEKGEYRGVSGTAWLQFDCGGSKVKPFDPHLRPGIPRLQHAVEVVSRVSNVQTQISLAHAQQIQADAEIGQTLTLDVAVHASELQKIVDLHEGILGWLDRVPRRGEVLVELDDVTVRLDELGSKVGRIVGGAALYPAHRLFPTTIEVDVEGFTLVISSLKLTTRGASGAVTVRLPGGIAAMDSCEPATIDLGVVRLTPDCELYVDRPDAKFGPWLLGDTGLQIEGEGYVLDLSTTTSPLGWSPGWRGLLLVGGEATGENLVPDPCNTGYLRGHYGFSNAVVVQTGFEGWLDLLQRCTFNALNPRGDVVTLANGWLQVSHSRIVAGDFGPGQIELPLDAVCETAPGTSVVVGINQLTVQPDLDLAGTVDAGGRQISWGELTHHGAEVMSWSAFFDEGYLYLPAGAVPTFSPESGGSFSGPSISSIVDASLTDLEAHHVAGVTFARLNDALLFSPDRPGGVGNPFKLPHLNGWLRIGSLGVDAELSTYYQMNGELLGEPARTAYAGVVPFDSDLFVNDRKNLLAQLVTSAAFDSNFGGRFRIPAPCDIKALDFTHMQVTSTGHLVGGDVGLPPGGVPLEYWQVQLVPTGPPTQAGVVSARTGRIIFLAAGIAEPRHFAAPFGLTWGEMLASGDLGELFLDFNNYGQRFDGISYNPEEFQLSKFVATITDPFLATCGSVHFPFFGPAYVNISDARDANPATPYFGRNVSVPKVGIGNGWTSTDLALNGVWKDIVSSDLAVFACPDATVDYNTTQQDGFIGTGTAEVGFFHSDPLTVTVEIHSDATDIRMSSADSHDIDLGLFARLSGIGEVAGCARIEGPLLTRMSFYGILEQSAQAGAILGPKAGYAVEINLNVTPSTLDFYASGDMLMAVGVEVEVSASLHLLFDFAMHSAEGELVGRINCDAAIAGLAGEGQITWHVDPVMQYLQGRMRVAVCSWVASGGLEGGFFVGRNVPKALAWVLRPTNPHFGVSDAVLPALLTGVFGYGQLSFGVNWYVFGGGVDLYAGMGAFTMAPPGLSPVIAGPVGLPYVIGACGVHVHGEILGGLVSASAWANLTLRGPMPVYFEGTFGLEGCVAWVLCASVDVTGGVNSGGFYLY